MVAMLVVMAMCMLYISGTGNIGHTTMDFNGGPKAKPI